METATMGRSDNPNKWKFILSGLTPENIDQVYKREFALWKIFHSDTRRLDGEQISPEKFMFMFIGKGFENIDAERFQVCNTSEGFPLKEKSFLEEEIERYTYIFEETRGSVLDRTVNLKCEIFLEYLRKKLTEFEELSVHTGKPSEIQKLKASEQKEVPELSLKQIALIFYYEGKLISTDRASGIAEEYGWTAKNSGHRLYQDYNFFSRNSNRLGDPGSKRSLNNSIKRLEEILDHLSDKAFKTANRELQDLKEVFNSQYL